MSETPRATIVVGVAAVPLEPSPPGAAPERWVVDPASRVALELAMELSARTAARVEALTIGPRAAEIACRYALARGADSAVWVDSGEALPAADAISTARLMAQALPAEVGLVLLGGRTPACGSGAVGPALAALLGLPAVSDVEAVEGVNEEGLRLRQRAPKGARVIVSVRLPAVVLVDPGAYRPQYISVRRQEAALALPIERRTTVAQERGLLHLVAVQPPKPRTKRVALADSRASAADRLKALMGGGAKTKPAESAGSGGILELPPDEAALRLIRFLEEKGFLPKRAEAEGG